jgi:flagellar assembly protein FliH
MTDKLSSGRISAENVGGAKSWVLPPVNDAGKVLSSAEKEARERRERLLKQGKERIENIEVPHTAKAGMTAKDMQDIFDTAEKDGFSQGQAAGFAQGQAEGYEAGRMQAQKEMQVMLAQEQQKYHQLQAALMNPIQAQDDDLETMLLDVICSLTQSVIERELLLDSSVIRELVLKAVDALPVGSKNIRIYVNEKDFEMLNAYAKEHHLEWSLNADPQLQSGGCRVETLESRVDYSVSLRLKTVLEQFLTGQLVTENNLQEEKVLASNVQNELEAGLDSDLNGVNTEKDPLQ